MKHRRDVEPGEHSAGRQSLPASGVGMAGSDPNRGQSPLLRRVSILGIAGTVLIALSGLLGYVPGLGFLGRVREGYIPMAPSTALSFIVLGCILLVLALRPPSGVRLILCVALTALVSLFGALEVVGHLAEMDLNFEDMLVPAAGHLGEIPIARMSPATGAAFLLAGLAVLAIVLRRGRTHGWGTRLGHAGGILGTLVLSTSLLSCLAYFYGSPLLYGRGVTVPMALTTALAFLMLGGAIVGVSGKEAIPVYLLTFARRAARPMSERRRFLLLILLMIGAATQDSFCKFSGLP